MTVSTWTKNRVPALKGLNWCALGVEETKQTTSELKFHRTAIKGKILTRLSLVIDTSIPLTFLRC